MEWIKMVKDFAWKIKGKNPQAKENIQARTTVVHLREYPRIQLFESSAKYEASPKAGGSKHCLLSPKQQSRNWVLDSTSLHHATGKFVRQAQAMIKPMTLKASPANLQGTRKPRSGDWWQTHRQSPPSSSILPEVWSRCEDIWLAARCKDSEVHVKVAKSGKLE